MEDPVIPDTDLARVQRWVRARNDRLPVEARPLLRIELEVSNRALTILECRPPWRPDMGTEWTRLPVARLRYTESRREWSLYRPGRDSRFHRYELARPSAHVGDLLAEIDRDPTCIFWG